MHTILTCMYTICSRSPMAHLAFVRYLYQRSIAPFYLPTPLRNHSMWPQERQPAMTLTHNRNAKGATIARSPLDALLLQPERQYA